LLVSASNDDVIRVYDTYRGKELNTLQSKKYGVANICYTHDPQSVVYSSTKVRCLKSETAIVIMTRSSVENPLGLKCRMSVFVGKSCVEISRSSYQ